LLGRFWKEIDLKMKQHLCWMGMSILLVLSACGQPFAASATEVPAEPAESAFTETAPSPTPVPEPQAGTPLRWYDGGFLVYVPSGIFPMGADGQDNPEHQVYLSGFWIYRTKVTNGMYSRCVDAGKCTPPGPDALLPDYTDPVVKDLPVVGVTWEQSNQYCRWISGHLPTEAEWEKAARGPDGNPYPWGVGQPSCSLANLAGCVGRSSNVLDYPAGVSPYLAFDFSGNVFEWVADWYAAGYYAESPTENPAGPSSGNVRAVRGSSFASQAEQMRPSLRYSYDPQKFRADLGFRCVVENAQEYAPPCVVSPYYGEPVVGAASSGLPACEPPPLNVQVEPFCQKKLPYVVVTLNGAVNLDLAGADCSPSGDAYVCTGADEQTYRMSACTTCEPPAPSVPDVPPSCPDGYTLVATGCACVYSGGGPSSAGNTCPTTLSMLYVPEQACCQAQFATQASPANPVCGPGYVPAGCTCVSGTPAGVGSVQTCGEFTVSLLDCDKQSGSCNGCSCYTTPNACYAAGCVWYRPANVCR
jgi:formylglycine-generating enzyme required for sulfatase activity